MESSLREMVYPVDDERIPLLYDPLIWFRPTLEDEDIAVECPDHTEQPSNGAETRPDATGGIRTTDTSPPSPQAEDSRERLNVSSSSLEARLSLLRTERERKSWIKNVFLKLYPFTPTRVHASHSTSKTAQGDDYKEGTIWSENHEQRYPMTVLLDPGSQYNLIDPDFALKVFPSGFRPVPEGSGGRFLDGSFFPFIGSVEALWLVGDTRFPSRFITTEFMVAERPLEYNLVIGKSEIRRHRLDSGERRAGIFGFIKKKAKVDPRTATTYQQDFINERNVERALQAQEKWVENRDKHARHVARIEVDNFVSRHEAIHRVTPSHEARSAQYDLSFRSAQEAYAQTYPCPPSPPGY